MWLFLLIVHLIMWGIVSTLSLISFFEGDRHPDGDEIFLYAFLSILKGLVWPITIWVALAFWASTRDTPYWVEVLIKLYKFGTTIQIKSYINDMIKPIFNKPSKKKIKEFEEFIEKQLETWPEDRRNDVLEEFFRTLERYKAMQPTKWRKWGSYLLKLISLLS